MVFPLVLGFLLCSIFCSFPPIIPCILPLFFDWIGFCIFIVDDEFGPTNNSICCSLVICTPTSSAPSNFLLISFRFCKSYYKSLLVLKAKPEQLKILHQTSPNNFSMVSPFLLSSIRFPCKSKIGFFNASFVQKFQIYCFGICVICLALKYIAWGHKNPIPLNNLQSQSTLISSIELPRINFTLCILPIVESKTLILSTLPIFSIL